MNVAAALDAASLTLTPGDTTTCDLRIRNTGPAERRFSVGVAAGGPSWAWCLPTSLTIAAGAEATARIVCRPPRDTAVAPGGAHFAVAISAAARASDEDDDSPTTVEIPFEMAGFADLTASMEPTSVTSMRSGRFRVVVRNRGNGEVTAAVIPSGSDPDVQVLADPPSLVLRPGATETSVLEARAARLFAFGTARPRKFGVVVEPLGGHPTRCEGVIVQQPVLSGRRAWLGTALVVAVVAVAVGLGAFSSGSGRQTSTVAASACPGAGHLAHDANGTVRANVVEPDNYSFLFLNHSCTPVRWNPCQPIHYVVETSASTPAELTDLRQAIATVSAAAGITFVSDGTAATPTALQGINAAARAQGRWPPLDIRWLHLGAGKGNSETLGGGRPFSAGGVDVSGQVGLNADAHLVGGAPLPDGFGAGVTWGRVMLHELGHVVGLGHVTATDEVMHEPLNDQAGRPLSQYGIGDLAGLRLVGRDAGCLSTPPVSALARPAAPPDSVPTKA